MLLSVDCSYAGFKRVEFTTGLNVMVADRGPTATQQDTCNGLGKSLLIEIIHFCLGAEMRGSPLAAEALREFEYCIEIESGGVRCRVFRTPRRPNEVRIAGDTGHWPQAMQEAHQASGGSLSNRQWCALLGVLWYGLEGDCVQPYAPTFRSLVSLAVRRPEQGYDSPFAHHRKEKPWQTQVNNAFLLGLEWRDMAELEEVKDQLGALAGVRQSARKGLLSDLVPTPGRLDGQIADLSYHAEALAAEVAAFEVHPEYRHIEARANELTELMHEAANENLVDRRRLALYAQACAEEVPPDDLDIEDLYGEAGVVLGDLVIQRLADVRAFHRQVTQNRAEFMEVEVKRLQAAVDRRSRSISQWDPERAGLMRMLAGKRALDDFAALQERLSEVRAQIADLQSRLGQLRRVEEGTTRLKARQLEITQRARRDLADRAGIRERAMHLFSEASRALYQSPGILAIGIGDSGLDLSVEVERSGSTGIGRMALLVYDLVVTQLLASREPSPRMLIHDSTVFEGVDSRQIATALEFTAARSQERGFQYICALNSDTVPQADFTPGFRLDPFVRLTLADTPEDACLMGFRF